MGVNPTAVTQMRYVSVVLAIPHRGVAFRPRTHDFRLAFSVPMYGTPEVMKPKATPATSKALKWALVGYVFRRIRDQSHGNAKE